MTRIRIQAAGHSFIAETHPDAPKTVEAFLTLLPYRQKIIHVRWSGEGCWVPLGEWKLELGGQPVGFENHTSHPAPGAILLYVPAIRKGPHSPGLPARAPSADWITFTVKLQPVPPISRRVEPSAAVPFAAMLEGKFPIAGRKVGLILTGGNADLERLPWQNS